MDSRIPALARTLYDYSLELKPGDKVLIEGEAGCEEMVRGLIEEAYVRGAEPYFEVVGYEVSTLDYSVLDSAMDPLVDLMHRTDQVRIVGPGTNLTFSIKGLPVIKCAGKLNIPDGEVFTAPVRESVQGRISFNTPSV